MFQSSQNMISSVSATALSQTLPSVPAGSLRIVSIIFIMWVCAGVCRCLWSRPAVSDAHGTGVSGSGGSPNVDTENQAWVL